MDKHDRELIRAQNRRRKVTRYLRKYKNALNIRYMERALEFRKGRIQKFASQEGNLTGDEINLVYHHLKKLTRF